MPAAVFLAATLAQTREACAYIGPGAGFAFISSFFIFFIAFLLAILVFVTLPFRVLLRALRRRRIQSRSKCRRVIVVGLDGMSPLLSRRLMDEGALPNFVRLTEMGAFRPLQSTIPSASPVAWSTFQTGTNPGKHNIFDFLTRNKQTYLPELSSTRIQPSKRTLGLGRYRIPLGRPRISFMRKSQSFWRILGEHGIFSAVLRVPITFPPEKFYGVSLSGMCVPDLRGSQGSFTYFTTKTEGDGKHTGGMRIAVKREGNVIVGALPGPPDPLRPDAEPLTAAFKVIVDDARDSARLECQGKTIELRPKEYSPWVRLSFRAGPGFTVTGICRFLLRGISPDFHLYVTPINIDPDRPALPVSHPFTYAPYLAKVFGPYATLGLAEDTWALNEQVIDEEAFLAQAYSIHEEREKMFFDALEKVDAGAVVCVFDITDRIQHMFWQYTPEGKKGTGTFCRNGPEASHKRCLSPFSSAVEEVYKRMDGMIGRLLSKVGERDVLIVMSDHGFGSFRRCVNLNAWLRDSSLLETKNKAGECGDYFKDVDWSRTKAYALGLGGIFINQAGRERQGIVPPDKEKDAVKKAIADGLAALRDPGTGAKVVNRVIDTAECYTGPYRDDAPDLIVGFANGYRASWDSVIGKFGSAVIEDNEKAWRGDHCMDPAIMPGVLFCNRRVCVEQPGIIDIAPTVLNAFGVPVPKYMEGRPILSWDGEAKEEVT